MCCSLGWPLIGPPVRLRTDPGPCGGQGRGHSAALPFAPNTTTNTGNVSVVTAEPNCEDVCDVYMLAGGSGGRLPVISSRPSLGNLSRMLFIATSTFCSFFYNPSVFLYSVLWNILKMYEYVTVENMNAITRTSTVSSDSSVVCVG